MTLPRYAFFKGQVVPYAEARVGVLTHSLNYGTAVFGGMRGYYNHQEDQLYVFRPQDHLKRFLQSTRLLRMELAYDTEALLRGMLDLLRAEGHRQDCYIRPLAFYADEMIGVRIHDLHAEVSIVAIPYGPYIAHEEGAHLGVSSWRRVDDNVIPARGKIAGAYVNSALAKSDAVRAGFDDAILLNHDGHVCEGSAANIFVIREGVALTPPVTDNILEGITRKTLISLLREELGVQVLERRIDRSELYVADEVLLVGTGVQVCAVTRIDHRPIADGQMGPITRSLRDLFFRIVRGQVDKYRDWLLPVYEK
ncbi:MAG: branched-chain amino acid transaminase [Myxococcales bacterium]|nr:branched-chain amino acid transaminase [Myxococcota bacterium]MDW8280453.1 branched-chain amino acid transaminase [Myxococcales bacterium]